VNSELVWFICPTVGVLSMLGGLKYKLFRRVGVPLAITATTSLFLGWSWWWPVLFISIYAVTTLPFTLIGDSLDKSWVNWVYIWLAGYLLGFPAVLINKNAWIYAFVPCVVQGVFGTLSNIKQSSKYAPWKFCEFIIWASMAYCYALSISLR
jgi:hypothetical protein